jgi:hypothetical protein
VSYIPRPIDTSAVTLTQELSDLGELLARNVHEVWAQQRMESGWRHGPEWDDDEKRHPYLVPFEELPEAEREFDRGMAMGAIKAILALGFRIQTHTKAD